MEATINGKSDRVLGVRLGRCMSYENGSQYSFGQVSDTNNELSTLAEEVDERLLFRLEQTGLGSDQIHSDI